MPTETNYTDKAMQKLCKVAACNKTRVLLSIGGPWLLGCRGLLTEVAAHCQPGMPPKGLLTCKSAVSGTAIPPAAAPAPPAESAARACCNCADVNEKPAGAAAAGWGAAGTGAGVVGSFCTSSPAITCSRAALVVSGVALPDCWACRSCPSNFMVSS